MRKPWVSVLIPAHNEEKVIEKPLVSLQKIKNKEYKNLEVIVGLDGCTDRTEEIVKRYKFVKLFKSRKRSGKHKLLRKLYRLSKGKIIIVHDADWIMVSKDNFRNIVKAFENPKIGGIADYKPGVLDKNYSLLTLGDSFMNQFLHEFKVKKQAKRIKKELFVESSTFPFFTNIFRKSALTQDQFTLCDDGERTIQLIRNGFLVKIPEKNMPYFITNYSRNLTISDLFKQKIRGEIARRQIRRIYNEYNAGILNFYIPAFFYTSKRALDISFYVFLGVFLYWLISIVAIFKGKFINTTTKEGWKMRWKR